MASSLVSPVLELLGALGDLQFSRKRSQSGSLNFQPVQISEQSRVKEVAELQSRFQAMSNEVSDVQRQLNRSIRNYGASHPIAIGCDECRCRLSGSLR